MINLRNIKSLLFASSKKDLVPVPLVAQLAPIFLVLALLLLAAVV